MNDKKQLRADSIAGAVDLIFDHLKNQRGELADTRVRLATPLGLGKPNQLLNSFYQKVKEEKPFALDIYTALSLDVPQPKNDLEARFLKPFAARHWGEDYPRLNYLMDMSEEVLPRHIDVYEFYVNAGAFKDNSYVQQHYRSMNYTHVAQNLVETGIDIIFQLVARRGEEYSLSVNSDLTLDVVDGLKAQGKKAFVVGVVHPNLPFLGGDAAVESDFFSLILEAKEVNHKLFAIPREPLNEVDTAIGLYASAMVEDGGTLQIGIGSLSDSIVKSLLLRQADNGLYKRILDTFAVDRKDRDVEPFQEGLYGTSEMIMDGFMHLRKAGILKREILDRGRAVFVHGAFALGSKVFYEWMNKLEGRDFSGFFMTRVSNVNDLYDPDEMSLRRQRKKARFFNTAMQVTALGAAASETLPEGTIVSGVGGQYNFVAMAHELSAAYSILMLRSTAFRDGRLQSNIVWNHGNITIPRHLRDVVITEYGIAFLRGRPDAEVIIELLNITDSAFQDELLNKAKKHRKVASDYRIPDEYRQNTRQRLKEKLAKHPGFFEAFPFGSDFNEQELRILSSLKVLKDSNSFGKLRALILGLMVDPKPHESDLARLGFNGRLNWKDKLTRTVLLYQFERNRRKT